MTLYQIQVLFFIGADILQTVVCVFNGVALLQANRKSLRHIQVWLRPIFVGNLLSLPILLFEDYNFFAGNGNTVSSFAIISILLLVTYLFTIFGMTRLVKMIHYTPASEKDAFAGIEPDPNKEGPWYPPPNGPNID